MKKLLALLTCALLTVAPLMVGCGGTGNDNNGGSNNKNKTVITIEVKSGGTGVQWAEDAGARFSALKGDYSYEDGKSGVVVEVKTTDNPTIKNAETSGATIVDVMGEVSIETAAREGRVVDISDVLTTANDKRTGLDISPLDKIPTDQRDRYMYNGKYYAGPSCEYYPVISYDKNLFDKYHTYFVRPEFANNEDAYVFTSDVLKAKFYFLPAEGAINNSMKSCGPDGVYNTSDDGLPSSLNELIALCELLKKEKSVSPFNFPGGYKYYSNFLLSALYTTLQGYDGARNNYEFDGKSTIVTGYTTEKLFGLDEVFVPTTQTVDVTEATGYLTTMEVEKYYAEAFMALCTERGWWGPSVGSDTQKAAISKFVLNGVGGNSEIAMHIDGSYWYNEGKEAKYFEQWKKLPQTQLMGFEERDVRIMPLPVNLTESVVEGQGKEQALLDMNYGMFVINSAIASNTGLVKAAKDFLAFLYTDAELSAYTASTSILRSMNYSLTANDENVISVYGKELLNAVSSGRSKVVYFVADNPTFKANNASLQQSWTNAVFSVGGTPSLYQALAPLGTHTVQSAFEAQQISAEAWSTMYKGN